MLGSLVYSSHVEGSGTTYRDRVTVILATVSIAGDGSFSFPVLLRVPDSSINGCFVLFCFGSGESLLDKSDDDKSPISDIRPSDPAAKPRTPTAAVYRRRIERARVDSGS